MNSTQVADHHQEQKCTRCHKSRPLPEFQSSPPRATPFKRCVNCRNEQPRLQAENSRLHHENQLLYAQTKIQQDLVVELRFQIQGLEHENHTLRAENHNFRSVTPLAAGQLDTDIHPPAYDAVDGWLVHDSDPTSDTPMTLDEPSPVDNNASTNTSSAKPCSSLTTFPEVSCKPSSKSFCAATDDDCPSDTIIPSTQEMPGTADMAQLLDSALTERLAPLVERVEALEAVSIQGCAGEGQLDGESSVLLQFVTPFDTNGVLHHISTAGGSRAYVNPHDSGDVIVSITNPHDGTCCAPERFVQHQSDGKYNWTDGVADSSMSVDLGADRSVVPSHYCLRNSNYYCALRNWELQGSNDGAEWSTLKQHQNDKSFSDEACSVAAWPVQTEQAFRHFRIQQTGPNSKNHHHLNCTGFELYGELKTVAHPILKMPEGCGGEGQLDGACGPWPLARGADKHI